MASRLLRSFALASALATFAFAPGCAEPEGAAHAEADVASQEGAWGHLALEPGAPQYLINRRPGSSWRVCVPRYMTTMLPNFESELTAAVKIWGHYVDRTLDVKIEVKDLPRATVEQSAQVLGRVYHEACGAGFDAVLGLAPLGGGTMGVTGGEGEKDGSGKWVSFRRFLFLRDFDLMPDSVDEIPSVWASYSAVTNTRPTADQLVALMKERSSTRYMEGARRMSFPSLVHEVGHVWGLCDQYEGARNCDPVNSTSHLVPESIMGGATARERVFLTDDDIDGIRALARRPGFDAGWPAPPSAPPPAVKRADVDLFRLDRITRGGGRIALRMGLVATKAVKLELAYRAAGSSAWRALVPQLIQAGADAPRISMGLPVDPVAANGKIEVRATLSVQAPDGSFGPPTTLTLAE